MMPDSVPKPPQRTTAGATRLRLTVIISRILPAVTRFILVDVRIGDVLFGLRLAQHSSGSDIPSNRNKMDLRIDPV